MSYRKYLSGAGGRAYKTIMLRRAPTSLSTALRTSSLRLG